VKKLNTSKGALDIASPAPAGYSQLIGPFMGSYELWALFAAHQASSALALMRAEWGPMTTQGTGSTFWEVMGTDGSVTGQTSMSHAWSTGPTSALTQYVLGVSPVRPGYASWLVEPQPGGLSWAEGQVPTPYGPIEVKWGTRPGTGQFALSVQAPAGTAGTIGVPVPVRSVITIGHQVVWDNGRFLPAPCVTGAAVAGTDVLLTVSGQRSCPRSYAVAATPAS
jgi:alpha-L-rhamnosidase